MKKRDLGWLWHLIAGAAIDAAVAVPAVMIDGARWPGFVVAGLLLIGGLLREAFQHQFDNLTLHQWVEAVMWGVGGMAVALGSLMV